MIEKLDAFADKVGFNIVITSSIAKEDLPENIIKFVIN